MSTETTTYDPFDDLIDDVDERGDLEASLITIRALRDELASVQEQLKFHEAPVRAWLEAHPGGVLIDQERGITAVLDESSKGAEFDLITFASKPENERKLIELAKQGVLTVRVQQLRGLRHKSAAADALLAIEAPGGSKFTLRVERQR